MPSVLLVCTANICRSPMAEALLRERVKAEGGNWQIASAGTWGMDGRPPATRAQFVLEGRGLNISAHRARTIDENLMGEFNLILTMEQGHKEALRAEFPEYASRVYLFSEMIGMTYDIKDPILGTLADFDATAMEIERLIDKGFERIRTLASDPLQERKV